jgi:twinkle protein
MMKPLKNRKMLMTYPRKHNDSKMVSRHDCDKCGSSDANTLFDDGHMFCFTCEAYIHGNKESNVVELDTEIANPNLPDLDGTKVGPLTERGIVADTIRHYGVRLRIKNGVIIEHYYPYHAKDGSVIAYKKRIVKTKDFRCEGAIRKSTLFGQSSFTKQGRYVTICEGEVDTLSAFQMMGSKFPVVGVKSAAEAYKNCKREFEWLDSYETIVICLDNDEPGQKAAKQVASLFPKKAKIIKLRHKDAGVYLENEEVKAFNDDWWQAESYRPDDILSGAKAAFEIMKVPKAEAAFLYPWDALNKVTYGMRTGEMVIVTAGSGTGKTQVLREISHHVLKTTDVSLGLIYLEETTWETTRGLVSIDLSLPTHLPDTVVTDEELWQATERTWGTDRVHSLHDSWRDNNVDYICDKILYLAKGLDCKLIILDHISFMVSDQIGDERKMLDEIGHKLKALTVSLDIHLCAVAHTRRQSTKPLEEGGITSLSDLRGTAGLGQLSNIVIGLERNGQHEDERERNTTLIRVLKNRFSGITGPTSYVYYDQHTGRLTEIDKELEDAD